MTFPPKEKPPFAGAAFKNNLQNKPYQNQQKKQGKFNRSALPTPAEILQRLGFRFGPINHAEYYVLRCPLHKNGLEQHPSLNFHSKTGHYKCHACGAKGGDALAFYIAATGKCFRDAAHDLGAWGAGL